MVNIVPEILTLNQYQKLNKEQLKLLRPVACPHCGMKGSWIHGCYGRKADRQNTSKNTLNPILVRRFFCPHCGKTCYVLPECISPRRWYLWRMQQIALLLVLSGKSLSAIAKEITPSRHTVSRWLERFKERLRLHKDVLCQHFSDLGRAHSFADFWTACIGKISLSKAMYFCHVAGVTIP
jgi:transposase-like protein